MSSLRARCPDCKTLTAVAVDGQYECHACGREFAAGLVRVPRAWGKGGEAMARAAGLPLPYPEADVIERDTLASQTDAIARVLPERPIVLGGCCCTHTGAIQGLAARIGRIGVVWLDAHGDLNTPDTSPSGNAWGMPLRAAIESGTVRPEDVALVGARNLDPPELEYMAAVGIDDDLGRALEGVDAVYIAFDADVLEERAIRCFMPEPGGLAVAEAESILRAAVVRRPLAGIGFTGLVDDSLNAPVILRLLDAVGLAPPSPGHGKPPSKMPQMSSPRIDVSIEHKRAEVDQEDAKEHPNTCPSCGSHYRDDELERHLRVCPHCGHHFPVRALARIAQLADEGTFVEEEADLRSADPLGFFDLKPYTERLAEAEIATGLGDAMVIGGARIEEAACRLAVMDFAFMGGSMGSVVGEKFVRACESAAGAGVPLVSVAASGGARMQEGILALMQLPKTVCAVEELHEAGCALLSVMTHPTTGGLLASFASLGDVLLAEPGALMSFAGPRVVQQTTREKLPDDFGRAEQNLRFGHIDAIVPRSELRPTLGRLLRLFGHAD